MSEPFEVVRHPRARRARLSVDPASGRVRLTLPPRAPVKAALAWAAGQQAWIDAQRARLPMPRPFAPGALVPFGDETLTIDWDAAHPRAVTRIDDRLVCGGPAESLSRRVELWLRREALRVLSLETAECAARAGVSVSRVTVGDPRGRWGSCASSGAIRYSWRLILAPAFVRRSTVAHEVAHRVHMNHSPAFHALAANLDERDPAESRAWLRAHGAGLHWFGRESE
ncbi:SprT family zinc-dependent metalloprotease [Sphingomonas sp. H39-1-10]|uniref:M48 family metallopeptidase n=1 Tax=Sphingomonas pollutisoli TaxID=3030829 RepID=UPI0023B906C3|nr:SprT family zinc-dependent metalloprotease [Sphingomonas pollutisoli]MDF0488039.1 SprT family zinc-dependent metalloprotease [Sphingomonas pollutisoli]